MEKDYSKYEGLVLEARGFTGISKVLVVNCDPDIGLTIVNANDVDDYVACVHCHMSPHTKKVRNFSMDKQRQVFNLCVEKINSGFWDFDTLTNISEEVYMSDDKIGANPSSVRCAFSQ